LPVHLAASGELLLGGTLATLPLTLYGAGAELGYRIGPSRGVVFTPYLAGHLMRGPTPAGLTFASVSYGGGFDVGLLGGWFSFHFAGELGKSENSLKRATSNTYYEVEQLTGQLLFLVEHRVSPWFALRAGGGYRAIGQISGGVLVIGGTL
jgi:hypothetical protein